MSLKCKLGLCALLGLFGFAASAAVIPFVKALSIAGSSSAFSSLAVPVGKVVIFDHMQFTSRTVTIRMAYNTSSSGIDSTLGDVYLVLTNPTPGYVAALPAPIRLYGGWSISNHSSTAVQLFGLAMDAADLYAGVGSEIDNVAVTAGLRQGDVSLASPRPVIATLEQSEDLLTWLRNEEALVQRGATPAQLRFTTPDENSKSFYRVKTRARQSGD